MIRVEGLYKSYISDGRQEVAVRGISFQHEEGEFLTLLGPSGCGKTTTLRCIAGLETPEEGEIYIGEHLVFSSDRGVNLSPARRRLGMVFQSYAIWPHMTVFDNVAYPLRFERVSKKDKRTRVEQILESVGLAALAQRPAPALSGGQQQRVALARALVAEPEVLLLDEPLSNLDASLRRDLGNHIRDLQRRLGLTVIYVTHDQTEAMSMSDRIALMDRGKILERGAPVDIYQSPQTEFGARFVGEANLFAAESVTSTDTGWAAETDLGRLSVSASPPDTGPEERYSVLIRPESLTINQSPAPEKDWNVFDGVVEASRYFGFYWELEVRLPDGGPLLKVKSLAKKGYDPGTSVRVAAHREACVLVRRISPTGPQPDPEDEKPQEAPDMADLNGP